MDDNNLLIIVLAFVVGFMLQGMMKNMCGGRLIEGEVSIIGQDSENKVPIAQDYTEASYPAGCVNCASFVMDLKEKPAKFEIKTEMDLRNYITCYMKNCR